MKVLNLQCQSAHAFEGWFASEDDFQSQLTSGLVECPLCGDQRIHKLPAAPRLNLSSSREVTVANKQAPQEVMSARPDDVQMQAAYLKLMRHMMQSTEDVGERFAQEARRIHHGESEARNIRGQASHEETLELLDEGIAVLPLPVPKALKEPLQ
jgi:hypothetical protein